MRRLWWLGGTVLAVSAAIGGVAFVSAASNDPLAYRDPVVVSAGETLYRDNCASCHGADLAGEPDWRQADADGYLPAPPHDATGHTWHHPDDILFDITKYGTEAVVGGGYKSRMPGFGDQLDDEEIRATLAFIKSTWPDRIIAAHDDMNAARR